MDLRAIKSQPSPDEREAVDAVLGPPGPVEKGLSSARARRHLLLPALHALQDRVGWISPGALGYVCERLEVPPAEGFGVASFYALFALTERPPTVAHVCTDVACKLAGADAIVGELALRHGAAGVAKDGAGWHESPCLGLCEQAPAMLVTRAGKQPRSESRGGVSAGVVLDAMAKRELAPQSGRALPQAGDPHLRLLRRVGVVDPTSLHEYRAHGGYAALRSAIEMGPSRVLRAVSESGLVGRGGAAFPTGTKWSAVAGAPVRPHYLVCNADESEPGTFKDRVLMEADPFAIVEAMTIAGFAIGAELGYVYVRAEYPLARQRLERAVSQARTHGLLGADILGRGVRFDIEIRSGAGAYICGEETALFASIEGYRGEPRSKPPFPAEAGLYGKPTAVNNVETLANVPFIIERGAGAYRSVGTDQSPGTRLFCVSGHVKTPGLYEHPFGVSLREVLERAGGATGGKPRAILLGGAAGTFVGAESLDVRLSFEDTKRAGVSLGSGVVLVVNESVPLEPLLLRIAGFFRDESCGQCVPCRVGTVRQEELVARLAKKSPRGSLEGELALLAELGQTMRDASICGLGQTASTAIESAVARLRVFRDGAP